MKIVPYLSKTDFNKFNNPIDDIEFDDGLNAEITYQHINLHQR